MINGKITSWKDDKGFGFISTENKNEQIFFHISSVKKAIRNPQVGDSVIFEISKDSQGRLKASYVLLEGVLLAKPFNSKIKSSDSVENNRVSYFPHFILIILFFVTLAFFINTELRKLLLITGIIFLLGFYLLVRKKNKPPSNFFTCAKCGTSSMFDQRTINAWNKKINRLYCKSCHQAWLLSHPEKKNDVRGSFSSSNSGCLGLFLVMAILPIACFVGTVTWLI